MNAHNILIGSGNFLTINKHFIKTFGLDCAVYLGAIINKENHLIETEKIQNGDSFYYSRELIEEDTGLSNYRQTESEKILKKLGILTIEKKGLPAQNYLLIASDSVVKILGHLSSKKWGTSDTVFSQHYIYKDKEEERREERETKNQNSDSVSQPVSANCEIHRDSPAYPDFLSLFVNSFSLSPQEQGVPHLATIVEKLETTFKTEKELEAYFIWLKRERGSKRNFREQLITSHRFWIDDFKSFWAVANTKSQEEEKNLPEWKLQGWKSISHWQQLSDFYTPQEYYQNN